MSAKLDYLTSTDWKALVANGVAIKRPGTAGFALNTQGLVEVLTAAFSAAPECTTLEDVVENGFALDHLTHTVVGLPVDDDRKEPTDPVEKLRYVDPVKAIGEVITAKLGGRHDYAVQANLVPKGKLLTATLVDRWFTAHATGLPVRRQEKVWAVIVSADLVERLVLEPEIKRAWSASIHAASNAAARMAAVPESAPLVLAALDAQLAATTSARATAYTAAIEGKTSGEILALDAAVSDLTESKVTRYRAALTGGSVKDA